MHLAHLIGRRRGSTRTGGGSFHVEEPGRWLVAEAGHEVDRTSAFARSDFVPDSLARRGGMDLMIGI